MTVEDALKLLSKKRPTISPNEGFKEQLKNFEYETSLENIKPNYIIIESSNPNLN